MGDVMELKQDIFSSFCMGQELTDKQRQEQYEQTPGFVFDSLCQEFGFMSLAKVNAQEINVDCATFKSIWELMRLTFEAVSSLKRSFRTIAKSTLKNQQLKNALARIKENKELALQNLVVIT